MAGYKAHMAFGIATAICWSILLIFLSVISLWFIPIIFFITVIGAFLPDLDSDSGLPIKILLIVVSLCFVVFYLSYVSTMEQKNIYSIIGYSIFIMLFVYYVIGGVIKKLTHHRGIFHSVPAVFLSILLSFTVVNIIDFGLELKVILSLSVGVGYLSHLVLDEMNSVVNLEGIPFIPKKSVGSALKIYSNNIKVTFGVYLLIIILVYYHWNLFLQFIADSNFIF